MIKQLAILTTRSVAVVILLGQAAQAEISVPMGTMTATINNSPYEGQTLDVPSEGTSTAEFRSVGPLLTMSIQAHDPKAGTIMEGIMIVEFSLMGTSGSTPPLNASVSWWPDGMNAAFFQSEEGGSAKVKLDSVTLDDSAKAKGSFAATLCRKDSFFAEPDENDCRSVQGRFDTDLRNAS